MPPRGRKRPVNTPKSSKSEPSLSPEHTYIQLDTYSQDVYDSIEVKVDASDTSRIKWTIEMTEALAESLYEQFKAAKDTDAGGFKDEAWPPVVDAVNAVNCSEILVDKDMCHNKWGWFKDKWKLWKVLSGMSGFGWDEQAELFKADRDVWDNLGKVRYVP